MIQLKSSPALYETPPVEVASAFSFRSEIEAVLAEIAAHEARISALGAEIERLRLIVEEDERWLDVLLSSLE